MSMLCARKRQCSSSARDSYNISRCTCKRVMDRCCNKNSRGDDSTQTGGPSLSEHAVRACFIKEFHSSSRKNGVVSDLSSPLRLPLPLRFYGLLQAEADAASDAPGVLVAAAMRQHTAAFCTSSEEVLSSLGLEIE